jgi:hypothetical protein
MLILPTLVTLLTYLYWRPHQIWAVFSPLTINVAVALVVFTYALDWRTGNLRPRGSALLGLLTTFAIWCLITVGIKAPDRLNEMLVRIATAYLACLFVSEGIQSLRALKVVAGVLMAFTVALGVLGVQQGLSPSGCYLRSEPGVDEDQVTEGFDGRSCTDRPECYEGGLPGAEYGCEHPGWLGTRSIFGRVRYRGILEDPNELSWALSMGIPLAFAFYEGKRSRLRLALVVLGLAAVATCVILTQSRSGALSVLAVLGVYFIRRYRWRGAAAALVVGLPVLLFGGRSGADAESSSEERLECWSEALTMFRENPATGVGAGQFTEHHFLTAHSSFLLTLAELGPVGLVLWTSAVYFAVKVTVRVQIDLAEREGAEAARSWSMALLASLAGLIVSAAFLSIAYHPILWIFLGLTAGLYAAVRRHAPDFRVRFGGRDLAFVCSLDTAFVVAVALYLRWKGI